MDAEMPRGKRTIPNSDLGFTSTRVFNTDMKMIADRPRASTATWTWMKNGHGPH